MGNDKQDHYKALLMDLVRRQENLFAEMRTLIAALAGDTDVDMSNLTFERDTGHTGEHGDVIEGVFTGIEFIGRDGKVYSVPQNYASKSKLVEGDLLKLTIRADGSFIYKQIGPVERERVRGVLARDKEQDTFIAIANDQPYKLLTASVTFHDGDVGDEVVLLIPMDGKSQWAAVENVIKR